MRTVSSYLRIPDGSFVSSFTSPVCRPFTVPTPTLGPDKGPRGQRTSVTEGRCGCSPPRRPRLTQVVGEMVSSFDPDALTDPCVAPARRLDLGPGGTEPQVSNTYCSIVSTSAGLSRPYTLTHTTTTNNTG